MCWWFAIHVYTPVRSKDIYLYPELISDSGDCLKLRAVHRPELAHLVDCIVFASVAKDGHQAAPAMSSGGDLDGSRGHNPLLFDL